MGLNVNVLSVQDYQELFQLRRWNMGSFHLFSTFFFILTQFSKKVSIGVCSVGMASGQQLGKLLAVVSPWSRWVTAEGSGSCSLCTFQWVGSCVGIDSDLQPLKEEITSQYWGRSKWNEVVMECMWGVQCGLEMGDGRTAGNDCR